MEKTTSQFPVFSRIYPVSKFAGIPVIVAIVFETDMSCPAY
jgi:hypothetical protein